MSSPEGLLLIDKPKGPTSHDVVDVVRRSLGTRKVGHAGTLDPMATGLLVVCVGRATRLLRYLSGLDKAYEGTARLGEETDTLDADGAVVARSDVAVTDERLLDIVSTFTGVFDQVPPAHSAVKIGGEPAYRAARRGEEVRTAPRTVRIDRFEVMSFDGVRDFDFAVDCSGGTYIRSLVADVGRTLSCGAHLTRLCRTRVGPFDLAQACSLDELAVPLPVKAAVAHLPRLDLDEHEAEAAGFGRPLGPAGIEGPYGVYAPGGRLIGIYRDELARAKPEMILAPPE